MHALRQHECPQTAISPHATCAQNIGTTTTAAITRPRPPHTWLGAGSECRRTRCSSSGAWRQRSQVIKQRAQERRRDEAQQVLRHTRRPRKEGPCSCGPRLEGLHPDPLPAPPASQLGRPSGAGSRRGIASQRRGRLRRRAPKTSKRLRPACCACRAGAGGGEPAAALQERRGREGTPAHTSTSSDRRTRSGRLAASQLIVTGLRKGLRGTDARQLSASTCPAAAVLLSRSPGRNGACGCGIGRVPACREVRRCRCRVAVAG